MTALARWPSVERLRSENPRIKREEITVKPHVNALGIYNFIRGFGWAYKRGGGGGYKLNNNLC